MLDALVSGKLIRDPITKTGPSGKPFCNFLMSVAVGDESPVVVSGIAFQDVAERIVKLGKGDSLAVVGPLKPSQWADKATGELKHGLNVTAQSVLSPYDVKRRRADTDAPAQQKSPPRASYGRQDRQPEYAQADGFDDDIPF
jgi:single-stranded DNA-binding protein